jgi:hypothetical protein
VSVRCNVTKAFVPPTVVIPATGSRECAPDDRLRRVSSTPRVLDSIAGVAEYWIVRSSRTMTNTGILATASARVLQIRSPQTTEGAARPSREAAVRSQEGRREDRVRAAPAISCANMHIRNAHTSIQVQRKQSGLPCAMVLRLISCSPRRDLACLSPSPPRSVSLSGT